MNRMDVESGPSWIPSAWRHLGCAVLLLLVACSADSPAEHESAGAQHGSIEARAVLDRVRSMRVEMSLADRAGDRLRDLGAPLEPQPVLRPAVIDGTPREGVWLAPTVPETATGRLRHRADVKLAVTAGGGFRLEERETKVAIDVLPILAEREAATESETVDGYVVYPRGGPNGADVVHRVSAEGTEDFIAFERMPAREELRYEVALGEGVAGIRMVSRTVEFLDVAGTPRLRMAPPYVVGADGAQRGASVEVSGCAYDVDPRGPWGRAVVPPGARNCAVRVAWRGAPYPALVDPHGPQRPPW